MNYLSILGLSKSKLNEMQLLLTCKPIRCYSDSDPGRKNHNNMNTMPQPSEQHMNALHQ